MHSLQVMRIVCRWPEPGSVSAALRCRDCGQGCGAVLRET